MNWRRSPYGFAHACRGQTMLEYVLIASAIAVSVCAAFQGFSATLDTLMRSLRAAL